MSIKELKIELAFLHLFYVTVSAIKSRSGQAGSLPQEPFRNTTYSSTHSAPQRLPTHPCFILVSPFQAGCLKNIDLKNSRSSTLNEHSSSNLIYLSSQYLPVTPAYNVEPLYHALTTPRTPPVRHRKQKRRLSFVLPSFPISVRNLYNNISIFSNDLLIRPRIPQTTNTRTMCEYEQFIYTCGHSPCQRSAYCHSARNSPPPHQCFSVKVLKRVWSQDGFCPRCAGRMVAQQQQHSNKCQPMRADCELHNCGRQHWKLIKSFKARYHAASGLMLMLMFDVDV